MALLERSRGGRREAAEESRQIQRRENAGPHSAVSRAGIHAGRQRKEKTKRWIFKQIA